MDAIKIGLLENSIQKTPGEPGVLKFTSWITSCVDGMNRRRHEVGPLWDELR